MRDVFIAGVGMTPFGKHLDLTLRTLAHEAVTTALGDAELTPTSVQAVYFSNAAAGLITGQEMIRGQVALRPAGLLGVPIINVENACASGSTAAHLAWLSVASGQHDIVLAVGAEKLIHPDKQRSFDAIQAGTNLVDITDPGPDASGMSGGSVMMTVYAREAAEYARRYGASEAELAGVAVKNRRHATANPLAQFRVPITVDDVLASRTVAPPLTLLMCSPLTDGAAALVLCSHEAAERLGRVDVRLRASVMASGDGGERGVVERAARSALERAAVDPADLDVVEVHDAAAPAEIMQYEQIGLCGEGEGYKLVADGETSLGGRVPVNTSGGLLSRGHPLGATGCAQLTELVLQLRGRADGRQVDNARTALAVNAGGWMGADYAAAVATVLSR